MSEFYLNELPYSIEGTPWSAVGEFEGVADSLSRVRWVSYRYIAYRIGERATIRINISTLSQRRRGVVIQDSCTIQIPGRKLAHQELVVSIKEMIGARPEDVVGRDVPQWHCVRLQTSR